MPTNTQRRGDRRRAQRAATRASIEAQFGIRLPPTNTPRVIGSAPGHVQMRGPHKFKWAHGGGFFRVGKRAPLYNTTGYPRCYV